MPRYYIGSPNGWRGGIFEAEDETAAIQIAAAGGENILDIQNTFDEDGEEVMILVVADEKQHDL